MNFIEYINCFAKGRKTKEFKRIAKEIGMSWYSVRDYYCKRRILPIDKALMIEKATNNIVNRKDLFPDFFK